MYAIRRLVICSCAALICFASTATAQEIRASVTGRVVDPSNAVVPGAEITITNEATSVAISTITNEQGIYRVSYLSPGSYLASCSITGFKTAEQRLELRVGTSAQADFMLEVGAVSESVEVTGVAPLLETTNADRGLVIDNRRINTIPLAQGNPIFLLALTNGANPGNNSNSFKYDEPAYNIASGFSFQGAPTGSNGHTLGGMSNNGMDFGGGVSPALQPPTDAIEEFKINQSFSVEQGHSSGTSIDMVLKTGTNDIHGTLYGFFRESEWGANDFFSNRAGTPKSDQTYKRLGGSVQGPIIRNRTFASFSLEYTRQKSLELIGTETVPLPEQLTGDFSQLLTLGSQFQIYDPLSTVSTGDGFFRRDPFLNNQLPASRMNSISKDLSQYWPAPNTEGGADGTSNFRPSTPSPTNFQHSYARVDHNFSPKSRLFFQFGTLWSDIQWKDTFDNLSTGHREAVKKQSYGLDYVYVLGPTTLLNLRYGWLRFRDPRFEKSNCGKSPSCFDITTLGLDSSFVQQLDLSQSALPHIFIEGYRGISDDIRNQLDSSDNHSVWISADHTRNSHNIKVGFEMWQQRLNASDDRFVMPRYMFGSDFTKGPLNTSAAAPTGQGLAAFLLGQNTGGFVARKDNFAAHNGYFGFFVQDNWRATPKLTVNFGLRGEYYGAITERYNRSTRGFDVNASSPIEAAAQAAYAQNPIPGISPDDFHVRGGLLFAGVGGQPRELYESVDLLWSPRISFAYRLGETSVLRAGYGIFFLPVGLDGSGNLRPRLDGFNRNTDFVPTNDEGVTFISNIQNPAPNGILTPVGADGGLATNLGQSVSFLNTEGLKAPYMQRWQLSWQRMLPNDVLFEAAYVGTRGTKLIMGRDLNALANVYLSTQGSRDPETIAYLTQSFANPFSGLLPGSSLNTALISRDRLLRPYPQFTSVNLDQTNQGYSWYHGLETKLEKRFSQGHTYILSYTWSKDMQAISRLNAADALPVETIAGQDRTHRLSVTAIVELPFGRGKTFGNNVSGPVNQVIGGWEVSAVWQYQGGFPLNFPDLFTVGDQPLQNVAQDDRTPDHWFNTDAGFVTQPALQPSYHLRTFSPRFGDVRSDRLNFWDISLIKNFSVTEGQRLQFQAQFLNAFNHTSFAGVNTNPSRGDFGTVSSDMTWPRRVMFGIKYIF